MKNFIGITMGDPKGIGPETLAKAWRTLKEDEKSKIFVYGDRAILGMAAEIAGIEFDPKHLIITSSTTHPIQKIDDSEAGRLAVSAIDAAISDIKSKKVSAIVTAPVNKRRIQTVKPGFVGHTEYFSKAAGVEDVVMMFASSEDGVTSCGDFCLRQLCVSLVTMHLPIKDVAANITAERVLATIRITHEALNTYFACPDARIAIMSLNPHAGEGGTIGTEEKTILQPAIAKAVDGGINCVGPLAADSLFRRLRDFDYDAVVAMYHDQGLIPVKILCQNKCVNITLGLPYVRTSPGHGTAEDIAWLGQADETEMISAIRMAEKMEAANGND